MTSVQRGQATDVCLSPVELLVFQGTPFCNIDCTYCYLPDRADRSRISLETIGTACRHLAQDRLVAREPEVLWHAGEPLVLPVDFYARAFATIEAELRVSAIRHKVQTNATLINDRWIDLFKTWNVSVGVSLDGPPHIHDRYRLTRSRAPTCERVLSGIARLKDAGLGLSVICVLTRESIEAPDELFAFFEKIGVDAVGFNIDEAEGPHLNSSHEGADPLPTFRRFLQRYFELVVSNTSKQSVRELTRGLGSVFRKDIACSDETVPIRVLTVGHNGDFGTFSPELFGLHHPEFGRLVFGNVSDPCAFQNLSRDSRFLGILKSIRRGIDACAESCTYYEVCKGGLPSNKLGEHGTFEATETVACKFKRQAVTDAVVHLLLAGDLQPLK
jgi:uncharacterized protein